MVSPVHGVPATISTAAAGTTTYTFTPADLASVQLQFTMDIVITAQVTPTFTQSVHCVRTVLHHYCLVLLIMVSPVHGVPATINTAAAGTTTYTFTPTANQCAAPFTMDIVITTQVTPTFTANWSTLSEQYCTITAWYF